MFNSIESGLETAG